MEIDIDTESKEKLVRALNGLDNEIANTENETLRVFHIGERRGVLFVLRELGIQIEYEDKEEIEDKEKIVKLLNRINKHINIMHNPKPELCEDCTYEGSIKKLQSLIDTKMEFYKIEYNDL